MNNYYTKMDKDPQIEKNITSGALYDIDLWSRNEESFYLKSLELAKQHLNDQILDLRMEVLPYMNMVLDAISENGTDYIVNREGKNFKDELEELSFKSVSDIFMKNVLCECLNLIYNDENFSDMDKRPILKEIEELDKVEKNNASLLDKLEGI